jgi:hypothetical protein
MLFSMEAAARRCYSADQKVTRNFFLRAALAAAQPVRLMPFVEANEAKDAEASEGLAFEIDELCHIAAGECYKSKSLKLPTPCWFA